MRNLILILAVTLSLSACKKEKLQNCMIGEWKKGSITLTVTDESFKFDSDLPLSYSIGKSNNIKFSNGRTDKVNCNGNSLDITFVSQDGAAPAISYEGTYTKK